MKKTIKIADEAENKPEQSITVFYLYFSVCYLLKLRIHKSYFIPFVATLFLM